jgi:glucoamylase
MAVRNTELDHWVAQQLLVSVRNLERAISATHLCRERKEFNQRIVPVRGSVLASPVSANWDPEPDYFFHWPRDAAAVMRATVDWLAMTPDANEQQRWRQHFHDMVAFNLSLTDSNTLKPAPHHYQSSTIASCRRFLRSKQELRRLQGDQLLAEPRFNPDGSVDILRWSRPQLDGPALRALACLTWLAEGGETTPALQTLLQRDLHFTLRHAGRRSIGPWEEANEYAHHYFVALVQLGALQHGHAYASYNPVRWQRAQQKLRSNLDKHWLVEQQVFAAIRGTATATVSNSTSAEQAIDSAIVLAILDADLLEPHHNVQDPRAVATLDAIAHAFAQAFPLNQQRPAGCAPALGRSLADRYFDGGAWYFTTLAAAAFCYRRTLAVPAQAEEWLQRGESWLATVRWLMPADGSMREQVDRSSKQPRSAQHLSWSYAAFISTARLRQLALPTGYCDS